MKICGFICFITAQCVFTALHIGVFSSDVLSRLCFVRLRCVRYVFTDIRSDDTAGKSDRTERSGSVLYSVTFVQSVMKACRT